MNINSSWRLVTIFCVAFVSIQASAQETQWQTHMTTGAKAYREGRYFDAADSFQAAVKEAQVNQCMSTVTITMSQPLPQQLPLAWPC